jgi:O-6-methylguanine DNA methyltransferase
LYIINKSTKNDLYPSADTIILSISDRRLLKIRLPDNPVESPVIVHDKSAYNEKCFKQISKLLIDYFSGKPVSFSGIEIDISSASFFEKMVWSITRIIPYGETRTYSWIAKQINNPYASRAVGQALKKNPYPVIIPCHRIILSDGTPGGYNYGIKWKSFLLKLENII